MGDLLFGVKAALDFPRCAVLVTNFSQDCSCAAFRARSCDLATAGVGIDPLAAPAARAPANKFLRTRPTLTERLLAVGISKGEETPRRGTPALACRVPMDALHSALDF